MDEVPSVLYSNQVSKFFCMAVAFLFADGLAFEIEFKNGTSRMLNNDDEHVVVINPDGNDDDRKILGYNIIGILEIMLPLESIGITCYAPWWNETDGLRTKRSFVTRGS